MEDWKEFSGKTVDEAIAAALAELGTTEEMIDYEVIEEGSSGFLGFNKKPAVIKAALKPVVKAEEPKDVDPIAIVKKFITDVLKCMDVEAELEVVNNEENETLEVQINGDDMGILIGKRGQTLDSLQYLASLAVTKETGKYVKVKLDTENYRARRKETLENLAKNIATKVKKTHRAVSLEPMNPYERRIIHSALQNDKYVETHSEGDEPFRKVIVTPKKGVTYEGNNRKGGRYGNKRYDSNKGGYGNKQKKISSSREFHKKYGADTKDYSTDYKKDYADYLEQKAAAKAAAQAQSQSEN